MRILLIALCFTGLNIKLTNCLVYKKYQILPVSWYQCNIKWLPKSLKRNTQFLGCLVKCFYFVWSKLISACQKSMGEGASIAVSTWCAVLMAKIGIGTAARWRVVSNVNVMACSESRSICMRRAFEYRISVITILPFLRQFHRRPSWFVNQREKKCLGIILILAAGTCCEKIRKEKDDQCTDFVQKFEFIQTRKSDN